MFDMLDARCNFVANFFTGTQVTRSWTPLRESMICLFWGTLLLELERQLVAFLLVDF